MRIVFERDLESRSRVVYDLSEVSTYGRYVLLFYQVPSGHEFERSVVFRRRLSFASSAFTSFIVKGRLELSSDYPCGRSPVTVAADAESEESFVPDSVSESSGTLHSVSLPPSSQVVRSPSLSGRSSVSSAVRSLFWIIMVRFETSVNGTERFALPLEGYPFCFVKRDLNYPGAEWLEMWQQWMRRVCIPGSENGYPIRVGGEVKPSLKRVSKRLSEGAVGKRSPYFVGRSKECVPGRVSPIGGFDGVSDDIGRCSKRVKEMENNSVEGLRVQVLEHRVAQLEERLRRLEDMLVRLSSVR